MEGPLDKCRNGNPIDLRKWTYSVSANNITPMLINKSSQLFSSHRLAQLESRNMKLCMVGFSRWFFPGAATWVSQWAMFFISCVYFFSPIFCSVNEFWSCFKATREKVNPVASFLTQKKSIHSQMASTHIVDVTWMYCFHYSYTVAIFDILIL